MTYLLKRALMRAQPRKQNDMNALLQKRRATKAKNAFAPSKRTRRKNEPNNSYIMKAFFACLLIILCAFGGKYALDTFIQPNPLLGKWRAQTTLGILEVEFTRDSMSMFGAKTPVSYDVMENQVIVIDESIKVGNAYKIIDTNTIVTEKGGFKTTYKRAK